MLFLPLPPFPLSFRAHGAGSISALPAWKYRPKLCPGLFSMCRKHRTFRSAALWDLIPDAWERPPCPSGPSGVSLGTRGCRGDTPVPSGDGEVLVPRDVQGGGVQRWRLCITVCASLLLEVLDWKGTWEARSEPWPRVSLTAGRVCAVSTDTAEDKHSQSRACGRAAASPRPPSTEGQIHLFIAITRGLCDPAALGLCLGKRLSWEGAERVLCGFPWKPQHEDGSSRLSRFNLVPSFPWYRGICCKILVGNLLKFPSPRQLLQRLLPAKVRKGRKAEVSPQHKSFCNKR